MAAGEATAPARVMVADAAAVDSALLAELGICEAEKLGDGVLHPPAELVGLGRGEALVEEERILQPGVQGLAKFRFQLFPIHGSEYSTVAPRV